MQITQLKRIYLKIIHDFHFKINYPKLIQIKNTKNKSQYVCKFMFLGIDFIVIKIEKNCNNKII